MLRIELRDGSVNLYQYAWLERVQFLPAEEADTLTLFFNRQSVCITGKNLQELIAALQRMAVEWVKERSECFGSIGGPTFAFVQEIQIVKDSASLGISKRNMDSGDSA
jgi:hypothetical protein